MSCIGNLCSVTVGTSALSMNDLIMIILAAYAVTLLLFMTYVQQRYYPNAWRMPRFTKEKLAYRDQIVYVPVVQYQQPVQSQPVFISDRAPSPAEHLRRWNLQHAKAI